MKNLKGYPLTILVIIGILVAVLMPGSDVPSVGIPHMDKVVHFSMFAILTLCFTWEYNKINHQLPPYSKGVVGFILLALLTEGLQVFAPGRSCDIRDLLCDSLGILITKWGIEKYIKKS